MNAQPVKSARQRLGEVLTFEAQRRGWNVRKLADICSQPRETIDNYLAGHVVPDGRAWESLKHVSRTLIQYSNLRQQALLEAEAERKQTIERRDAERRADQERRMQNSKPTIGTNLGDKLAPVIPILKEQPTVPTEPPKKPRKPMAPRPQGMMTADKVREREDFVRGIFLQRPRAPIEGPDGVRKLVRDRFGIGLSSDAILKIKNEMGRGIVAPVATEAARQAMAQPIEQPMPHQAPERLAGATLAAPPRDFKADIAAAIKMIADAVPGLRRLVVEIDDDGAIKVAHQIRETRVVEDVGTMELRK